MGTLWGMVTQWLEHRTLNREDQCLNSLAAISKLGQFCSLHVASVASAVEMIVRIKCKAL